MGSNVNETTMKENIFDVLMYLFENYLEDDSNILPNNDAIRTELLEAGFEQIEVKEAFDWLESLTSQRKVKLSTTTTFRIFSPEEKAKLDLDCLNYLVFLEQTKILSASNRELVIDRVMALTDEELPIDKLKWIVLMVLFSQPNEEIAFSRMEDLVYDNIPARLH